MSEEEYEEILEKQRKAVRQVLEEVLCWCEYPSFHNVEDIDKIIKAVENPEAFL